MPGERRWSIGDLTYFARQPLGDLGFDMPAADVSAALPDVVLLVKS